MPVESPLPLKDTLDYAIGLALILKMGGASNGLVSKALSDANILLKTRQTAETISNGLPPGYNRVNIYQPQPSYPLD